MRPRSNPWIELGKDGVAGRSSLIRRAPRAPHSYFLRTLFFLGFAAGGLSPSTGFSSQLPPRTITGFSSENAFSIRLLPFVARMTGALMPIRCSATNTTRHYWQIDPACLNSTTVAEQGVRLVEEESIRGGCHIKHAIHVLFRFTNMLAGTTAARSTLAR